MDTRKKKVQCLSSCEGEKAVKEFQVTVERCKRILYIGKYLW